ncbi:MAG: SDR family oxidoreductase [Candidatus Zixiibacteriota bacterium]|nr:MAG: SDR family oxidoreductase [candidate division Zixibacteria bacterium]
MIDIRNNIVVITGASRGIGAEIARAFAKENCKLVLCGRDETLLNQAAESCALPDGDIITIRADIRKAEGIKRIVDTACNQFGRVDIFVNNAGVGYRRSIVEVAEAEYDSTFDTNLKAVFLSFKELIPRMKKQGGGQIINISSMAAQKSDPGIAVYAASKAALNKLSESVAGEVRGDNIKICVVAPGYTATDMSNASSAKESGRLRLSPAEVADAVVYLARQNENAWVSMVEMRPLIEKK